MAKTATRQFSRRKVKVIQAYCIIAIFVLAGGVTGYFIGRSTAPKEVQTVTMTETVEVPTYSELPEVKDIEYFDVPLSKGLQRYISEICAEEDVPVGLVMAMIDHESNFNPEAVSETGDYGLMQINEVNHEWLKEEYQTADMLDPYQNVFCGVKILSTYLEKYEGDTAKALMAYNMGDYGARKAWANGINSTQYTVHVMGLWEYYEGVWEEVKANATSSDD